MLPGLILYVEQELMKNFLSGGLTQHFKEPTLNDIIETSNNAEMVQAPERQRKGTKSAQMFTCNPDSQCLKSNSHTCRDEDNQTWSLRWW